MEKHFTAALATSLLTFWVSGFAVAVDTVKKTVSEEWVPEGFESLNEPQVTEIDLYYGNDFLTSVFARFTQKEISFLEPDSITLLLKNLSDPEAMKLLLQESFATNASEICNSEFQLDCGKLQTDSVGIIFDRTTLRADLFINPELLLAGQPLQDRFLPDSSSDFSLYADNAVFFSGVDRDQTTYNFVNTTRVAFGESRLLFRSNLTDTQGLSVDTLALQREYQGMDYQLGLFRGNASTFRFMGSEQFVGASVASSMLTRIDLEQSLGSEIELFFGSRSRIEILRDDRLLASGYYDVGNQIIDTSMLPSGSYDIEIRITDASGVMTTENRFYSKTSRLPPADQSIYFLQAGKLADSRQGSGIPEITTSVLRGGFSKRLAPSFGADLGFSAIPDSMLLGAGLFKMGNTYQIKSEVALEDNGAYGADLAVRWDLDFIRLNLSARKVWEGDTQLQLGEGGTQSSASLDMPIKWGNVGVFARTNKRAEGINSTNYGLRWQTNSYSAGSGSFSAGFEVSKNDDELLAMFSMSYRFSGERGQHSFTPAISYENFAADNFRQTRMQGTHISSWDYGDDAQRRLSLRANHDAQTSFEARYEDERKIGDTEFGARYTANTSQLEYNGKLSTSFGYTRDGASFGGRPEGESAFIISVDGVPEGSEFDVIINGSSRGKTLSGKRLLVPVAPYETYRVDLSPVGDTIIDLANNSYRKTVYPGNVIALNWSARVIKIIIGRIVDPVGEPVKGALIRNVNGFGVTDEQGFFQVEIDQDVDNLIVQRGTDVCKAEFEIADNSRTVVSLGTLVCEEVTNPLVRIFPQATDDEQLSQAAPSIEPVSYETETDPTPVETPNDEADLEVITNLEVRVNRPDTELKVGIIEESASPVAGNTATQASNTTQSAIIAADPRIETYEHIPQTAEVSVFTPSTGQSAAETDLVTRLAVANTVAVDYLESSIINKMLTNIVNFRYEAMRRRQVGESASRKTGSATDAGQSLSAGSYAVVGSASVAVQPGISVEKAPFRGALQCKQGRCERDFQRFHNSVINIYYNGLTKDLDVNSCSGVLRCQFAAALIPVRKYSGFPDKADQTRRWLQWKSTAPAPGLSMAMLATTSARIRQGVETGISRRLPPARAG